MITIKFYRRLVLGIKSICMLLALTANFAYAIDCPPPPKQADEDLLIDAKGAVGVLLGLRAGELEGRVEKRTHDLFSKYPHAHEIVIKNLMINVFCQMLNESAKNDDEKFDLFLRFNGIVNQFQPPNPGKVAAHYHQLVDLNKRTKEGTATAKDPFLTLSFVVSGLKKELSQDDYIQGIALPDKEYVKRMGWTETRFVNDLSEQIAIYLKYSYPAFIKDTE